MSDLTNQSFWLVSASVFIGGIIGSPHCLSMCGPIVLNFTHRRRWMISYQFGRMLAYSAAGALLGKFGESLLSESRPLWVSSLTLGLIAVFLIFNGYRSITNQPVHFSLPPRLNHLVAKLWILVRWPSLPKSLAAGFAGFLTVFLPCGHLYGFFLGAAVMGSAFKGAIFMFLFWLGSAPLLTLSGGIFQVFLCRKFNEKGKRWAGVLLVASGIFSLASFSQRIEYFSRSMDAKDLKTSSPAPHHCH